MSFPYSLTEITSFIDQTITSSGGLTERLEGGDNITFMQLLEIQKVMALKDIADNIVILKEAIAGDMYDTTVNNILNKMEQIRLDMTMNSQNLISELRNLSAGIINLNIPQ
jgi:hypothetical protein